MDKYTVDLDKVLNDFEYSELTDQNNGYSTASASNQPVFGYASTSSMKTTYSSDNDAPIYPKPAISSTKHSINNVFHSLNEYLNSDIKSDIDKPGSSLADINEIEANMPSLIRKNSKDKDVASIQEIFKSISKDEDIEITNNLTPKDCNNTINSNVKTINNNVNSKVNLNNFMSNNNQEIVEITEENPETKENSIVEEPEDEPAMHENAETIENNKILSVSDEKIEVMIVQPVGFGDIELSDTEMENELAELEAEYKEKLDNNYVEEENLRSELDNVENKDKTVISEKLETDVNNQKDCNYADEATSQNITETIEVEKQNTAEPVEIEKQNTTETVEIEKQNTTEIVEVKSQNIDMPIPETKEDSLDIEELQSAEENNCEIPEQEEILIKDEDTVSEDVEKIKDDPPLSVEETNDDQETKIERRNSMLLRPSSLDLNSESTSENLTINLIGAPGSTPYNNAYMTSLPACNTPSKPPKELQEPDLDVNNSLSPTLSDASTYDNSDSPNTSDSCNDTSLDEITSSENTTPKTAKKKSENDASSSSENQNQGAGDSCGDLETGEARDSSENCQINEHDVTSLGKSAPFWTPDSDASSCLHCNQKFTVIKRRHHCRACGLVLCSKCCSMKCKLEYMDHVEARVCTKCFEILTKDTNTATSSGSENSPECRATSSTAKLNPNNPMEYCSTVPPHQQVAGGTNQPPTVMVPVGVLKRKGSGKTRSGKSVMFCDGIRPGCDLTELDHDFNYKESQNQSGGSKKKSNISTNLRSNRNLPKLDPKTSSYIPAEDDGLPPIVNVVKADIFYAECTNNNSVIEMLKNETVTFAIQRNFHIQVRVINMDCCINKQAWCFCTEGMIAVGQDEIVILLELIDNEKIVPKDVFLHLNNIYNDAVKGTSITEMGISIHPTSNFLESKNHAGFLYIKPTFQCIQNVILPAEPYLMGILIHRWETPWAKIFPLRLLLRLGAEYRYYPSPIISTRHRDSVYVEIGHTIINLLADFRNFSYTIPAVRGLTIHMEEKNTTVSIPMNRYDQVMKALNNSSDHILAFAANFSPKADSHLVCIQDTHGNNENAYTTHAINIHNKPRKENLVISVTGASFIVLNGALKSSSGLTAKSSIIEDGLMIQILPEQMLKLRSSLRNMKDFRINCGCVNAQSDESVSILWIENDVNFNMGVISPIDNMTLGGVPSIRVHNGRDFPCNSGNKMIRWTEVFIIQSGEECTRTQDPVDISKISESISKATSQALVKYLDLLATNSCTKIGIRTTLHIENVSYLAGSNGTKLPPIYMKSLDNELIPVLHRITANFGDQASVILELMFHILNV